MRHRFPVRRSAVLAAAASAVLLGLAGCGMQGSGSGMAVTPSTGSDFRASLSGAAEVPPTTGEGRGTLEASLDKASGALRWKLDYTGLSGPATMAHLHGPALPGSNAGVVVPFPNATTSPSTGSATLTPAQIADLTAGKWYVNVHTQKNPGGEIRGQLTAK